MRLIPTKCPNCGASIEVDFDSEKYYCSFCRQNFIDADFKHTEHIERIVDDAEIKKQDVKMELINTFNSMRQNFRDDYNRSMKYAPFIAILALALSTNNRFRKDSRW